MRAGGGMGPQTGVFGVSFHTYRRGRTATVPLALVGVDQAIVEGHFRRSSRIRECRCHERVGVGDGHVIQVI